MGDLKVEKNKTKQNKETADIHSRLTFWHAPTMGSLSATLVLEMPSGDAVKIALVAHVQHQHSHLVIKQKPQEGQGLK